jgi:hypothetical protein
MRGYLDVMDTAPWQGPPLPAQPPRALAALGPRMLELAAERSAGALLYNGTPEATATARSVIGSGPLLAPSKRCCWRRTRPRGVAERVRSHLDAGADHVCVQVLDPDPNGLPMASWRALAPALLEPSSASRGL